MKPPINKQAKELKRQYSKQETHIDNNCVVKVSISLPIQEMEIRTTLGFFLTPVRMAIIHLTKDVGNDSDRKEPLLTGSWGAN